MVNFRILGIVLFCTQAFLGNAQADFKAVDAYVMSISNTDSLTIGELTMRLTSRYPNQLDKARAIYTWMANTIAYDCPAYHSEGKRKSAPEDVYRLKKAEGNGFANLFLEMCGFAKIHCVTIDGFVRLSHEEIGEPKENTNHTWNAIRIDNEWYIIDAAWGSGYTDKKVKVFTKAFADQYFNPDAKRFIASHYPKLDAWKPPKTRHSKKDFFESPVVQRGFLLHGLDGVVPTVGTIKTKENKDFDLTLTVADPNTTYNIEVVIGEGKYKAVVQPEISTGGNKLQMKLKHDKPGVFPLTIFVNGDAAVQYMLQVD